MTQAELAARASQILGEKISRSLVSMFLIGERTPDIRQARALSKALAERFRPGTGPTMRILAARLERESERHTPLATTRISPIGLRKRSRRSDADRLT